VTGQLIVATGHNNWAMSNAVEMVAKSFVDGKEIDGGMLNLEAAIGPMILPFLFNPCH